jgi:glutamate dehydrogenase/leucine dehydrogenase
MTKPYKVISLSRTEVGLEGFLVIDSVALGTAIGWVALFPRATEELASRFARRITLKNAISDLPHGGACTLINADPNMPLDKKEKLVRAFADSIRDVYEYIPTPGNLSQEQMVWIHEEIGRCIGLPRRLGGIPWDEIGACGYGVAVAARAAANFCGVKFEGARVAVQGFGPVGKPTAAFLAEKGCRIVAVADSKGAIFDENGLDVNEVSNTKKRTGSVIHYSGGQAKQISDIVDVDCEIWIPAAIEDVVDMSNVARLRTRLVIQGANMPLDDEAERYLFEKGVIVVPDFVANAGGVICGLVEYNKGEESTVFPTIEAKIGKNTEEVLRVSKLNKITPRKAATTIALQRIEWTKQPTV